MRLYVLAIPLNSIIMSLVSAKDSEKQQPSSSGTLSLILTHFFFQ